jgi:phosphatidylinositol-3-phosphatase
MALMILKFCFHINPKSIQMKKAIPIVILFFAYQAFSQTVLPVPEHIVILILENHGYSQIINSSEAPFINALANDANSALFRNSYAIEHPSQPNYLDLFSGSNQGVRDDRFLAKGPFITDNLGRQLIDSGRTFITYSEGLPYVGFNKAASGKYVRKHNPAANWMGTGPNQIPATTNQPFTAFPSTNFELLPTVCCVVPNQNNNMHDGSIKTADTWVSKKLNSYIQWAKTHNSLFILTFDEDNDEENNKIVTIFTGKMVKKGQYSKTITHYSILRTIEEMYGLPFAGKAKKTSAISDCWIVEKDMK